MTRLAALVLPLVLAISACGHHEERAAITGRVQHDDGAPPRSAPHGGSIGLVAVTEQGDAAISVDDLGSVRLWPALDGSREPVPLHVALPAGIALAHADGALLAAIVDDAAGVELVRIAADGRVRGRAQLPCEIACVQVIAFDDGVLVRRADQSIERYDAAGHSRGRVSAEPGERVTAIAARHGAAIALVNSAETTWTTTARWLELGDTLRWGASLHLPVAVRDSALALAPSHRRIAALDTVENPQVVVFDLAPVPALRSGTIVHAQGRATLGFADDEHLAAIGDHVAWWRAETAPPPDDPWATSEAQHVTQVSQGTGGGAVGDGIALAGSAGALAIARPDRTRYLGWSQLAILTPVALAHGFAAQASGTRLLWLDDELGLVRDVDLQAQETTAANVVALDERHVAIQRATGSAYSIDIVDLDHPEARQQLGAFARIETLVYDPVVHQLVIGMGDTVARYDVDLAHDTATRLAVLHAERTLAGVYLVEPALASGVIAYATEYDDAGLQLVKFRAPRAGEARIEAERIGPANGTVLAVDATGAAYVYASGVAPTIVIMREGREQARFATDLQLTGLVASREGARIAEILPAAVVLRDASGRERWRHTLWRPSSAAFSADERRLVVHTIGGFIVYDAASGKELSRACGWGFGLHADAPAGGTFGDAPVCEDTRER